MSHEISIAVDWTGESFQVAPASRRLADEKLVVGQRYIIKPEEPRSAASHRHEFAEVREAWMNLPEDAHDRWPTSEHLRKWALIKTGWREERSIVCSSAAEANRIKAFIRGMDDYAVVVAQRNVVIVMTAKSQSMKAMGKIDFQRSKDDVLRAVAELIGTLPSLVKENAGKAA